MANKKIFCNVPWTNMHLYWDGTYGACCSERMPPIGTKYNIKNTSLINWYSSDTIKSFRSRILSDNQLPECNGCYIEESNGHESRRIKENFKSVIFTKSFILVFLYRKSSIYEAIILFDFLLFNFISP